MLTHLTLQMKVSICKPNQMVPKYWILVMIITIKYKDKWGFGRRTTVTLYVGPMKAMLLQELNMMWIFLKISLVNVSTSLIPIFCRN